MRLICSLSSLFGGDPQIIQVANDLAGSSTANGQFTIPMFEAFDVDSNSFILDGAGNINGEDVVSESYARLLARYPQYDFVYFNPLITDDHVNELDLGTTFTDPANGNVFGTRAQTGRAPGGALVSGQCPNNTSILPQNDSMTPARPGVLISDQIDISPFTGGAGADEFLVTWHLYDFEVTDDVYSTYGATAGQNTPAQRLIRDTEQEPADLEVYLSVGGGAWTQVGRFEPLAFAAFADNFRIAFVNRGSTKLYLTSFAVLF